MKKFAAQASPSEQNYLKRLWSIGWLYSLTLSGTKTAWQKWKSGLTGWLEAAWRSSLGERWSVSSGCGTRRRSSAGTPTEGNMGEVYEVEVWSSLAKTKCSNQVQLCDSELLTFSSSLLWKLLSRWWKWISVICWSRERRQETYSPCTKENRHIYLKQLPNSKMSPNSTCAQSGSWPLSQQCTGDSVVLGTSPQSETCSWWTAASAAARPGGSPPSSPLPPEQMTPAHSKRVEGRRETLSQQQRGVHAGKASLVRFSLFWRDGTLTL